jgi:hypothetical protein
MKILVIATRLPIRGGKGDQTRSFGYVRELSRRHAVTVVSAGRGFRDPAGEDALRRVAQVMVVDTSVLSRALGSALGLLKGLPLQVGWMMPPPVWNAARRQAAAADVALAVTVRSLCGELPVPVVVDHVDALSLNMQRRAHSSEAFWKRLGARVEAVLLKRWERLVGEQAAAQLITSPRDRDSLPNPARVRVMPVGLDVPEAQPPIGGRDFDVVFSGNMAYGANRDAADWLAREIAPTISRLRPQTTFCVVGRNAGALSLPANFSVFSDVADLGAFLRRSRVAIVPLRIGTGSSNKVLEAIGAGAAVVSTGQAVEPFSLGPPCVRIADSAGSLAHEVVELLEDDAARTAQVAAARDALPEFDLRAQGEWVEALLEEASRARGAR